MDPDLNQNINNQPSTPPEQPVQPDQSLNPNKPKLMSKWLIVGVSIIVGVLLILGVGYYYKTYYEKENVTDNTTMDMAQETLLKEDFLLPIEDAFSTSSYNEPGVTITGIVTGGQIEVGDKVELVGINETKVLVVAGINAFRRELNTAKKGENVGIVVNEVSRADISRGMVLAFPGSMKPVTEFEATYKVLDSMSDKYQVALYNNKNYDFYFRTTEFAGVITSPKGPLLVKAGEEMNIQVRLEKPVAIGDGELLFSIMDFIDRTAGSQGEVCCQGAVSRVLK